MLNKRSDISIIAEQLIQCVEIQYWNPRTELKTIKDDILSSSTIIDLWKYIMKENLSRGYYVVVRGKGCMGIQ